MFRGVVFEITSCPLCGMASEEVLDLLYFRGRRERTSPNAGQDFWRQVVVGDGRHRRHHAKLVFLRQRKEIIRLLLPPFTTGVCCSFVDRARGDGLHTRTPAHILGRTYVNTYACTIRRRIHTTYLVIRVLEWCRIFDAKEKLKTKTFRDYSLARSFHSAGCTSL